MQSNLMFVQVRHCGVQINVHRTEGWRVMCQRIGKHQRIAHHHNTASQHRVVGECFGDDLRPNACGVTHCEREWLLCEGVHHWPRQRAI